MAHEADAASAVQIGQLLIKFHYQSLPRQPGTLPDFSDVEFRCHSQNGEDGILLYLFSLLGATTRRVVEICAGSGIECNAANLLINHGWHGLLVDGDPAQIAIGQQFYAQCRTTWLRPPSLVASWVTAENVNALVREQGFTGDLDLLSLDIDGNDYWIWRALDCIAPRVVVLEFNTAFGPHKSVTLPYQPEFRLDYNDRPYRCGASLAAFVKLGRQKGYRLVGVQSLGFNAFFVRDGLGEDVLPERTPQECYALTGPLGEWRPTWVEAMYRGGQTWDEV
jgi:hypothetical protein